VDFYERIADAVEHEALAARLKRNKSRHQIARILAEKSCTWPHMVALEFGRNFGVVERRLRPGQS
jgi:hypothetical protein